MARCPDVQLRPLSRLKHYAGNLVMARLTQSVFGMLAQHTLCKWMAYPRDLFRNLRIRLSYACGNPWSWL
jgi:hypothetical protein